MSEFLGPLFIVGFPRSGTKLLRTLIRNHSKVEIPLNETKTMSSILSDEYFLPEGVI